MAIECESLGVLLQYFTLEKWLLFVDFLNSFTSGRMKQMIQFCYGLFFGCFLLMITNISRAFYYSRQGRFEEFQQISIYFYCMTKHLFYGDDMILFSMIFDSLYVMLIIDYFHFRFMKLLPRETSDLLNLLKFNIHYRFTLIDCLFKRNSLNVETTAKSLAPKFSFSINRFLILEDFVYLFKFFKNVELSFFISMMYIISLVILIFSWAWINFFPFTVQSLTEHIISQIMIIAGLLSTWIIILLSSFILKVYIRPWIRHTKEMTASLPVFLEDDNSRDLTANSISRRIAKNRMSKAFVRKLYFGRRLFVVSFAGMIRLNNLAISTAISQSVSLCLIGNVIFITEMIIGDLNIILQIYLPFICVLQRIFFLSFLNFIAFSTKHFYRPSKMYLDHYVKLSMLSGRRRQWKELFCLSRFIETIHPETHWSFTLGMLGKITRHSMMGCGVIYTSLIMFICPFIYK